jgi:hypothetical protein
MRSMAGRGRGWGAIAHGGRNYFHHPFDIAEYVIVPETENTVAARLKISRASCVIRDARHFVVLSAVELDHEARAMAGEICEVRTDRCLAAEVGAVHRQMTKVLPQETLGVGRLMPHCASARHAQVAFSLARRLLQAPPTPDPSPPLASLVWGGEKQRLARGMINPMGQSTN